MQVDHRRKDGGVQLGEGTVSYKVTEKLAADLVVDAPAAETPDAWRDALKRDPAYAGAGSKLWELAALRTHYHPSVRKFAAAVQSEPRRVVDYGGDPLADLSLQAFLDRFAYRNPKKSKKRATSPMNRAVSPKRQRPWSAGAIKGSATCSIKKSPSADPVADTDEAEVTLLPLSNLAS